MTNGQLAFLNSYFVVSVIFILLFSVQKGLFIHCYVEVFYILWIMQFYLNFWKTNEIKILCSFYFKRIFKKRLVFIMLKKFELTYTNNCLISSLNNITASLHHAKWTSLFPVAYSTYVQHRWTVFFPEMKDEFFSWGQRV